MLLHELAADAAGQHRSLWLCMGDFKKAFPKVWRDDIFCITKDALDLNGGNRHLLGSMLEYDTIHTWLSGCSSDRVMEGLPEGGGLGPLLYPTLPDTLVRELIDAGHGIGIGISIPECWRDHRWSCVGTPITEQTDMLVELMRAGKSLPPASLLRAWPELEASAAFALDRCAPHRIAAILHCDDPVFLASSRGGLQAIINIVADWAQRHRAQLHAGSSKSVVMIHGSVDTQRSIATLPNVFLPKCEGGIDIALQYANSKKWLGLLWSSSLDATSCFSEKLHLASAAFPSVAGLIISRTLPLHVGVAVFEQKIASLLHLGNWWHVCNPAYQEKIDTLYHTWAKVLLGCEPWRHGAIPCSELGWHTSGSGRAIIAVACRRAKLWLRSSNDLYRQVFVQAHFSTGFTWASSSRDLLRNWNIPDWPDWQLHGRTFRQYKAAVKLAVAKHCRRKWLLQAAKHSGCIPYLSFQPCCSDTLAQMRRMSLPWDVQTGILGWSRLRADLAILRCVNGRRSQARIQSCIFCGFSCRNGLVHVLGVCSGWAEFRDAVTLSANCKGSLSSGDKALLVLKARPKMPHFVSAVRFADAVDSAASDFWGKKLFTSTSARMWHSYTGCGTVCLGYRPSTAALQGTARSLYARSRISVMPPTLAASIALAGRCLRSDVSPIVIEGPHASFSTSLPCLSVAASRALAPASLRALFALLV